MSKLIRVIQGGNNVREYRLDALLGQFFDRLERAHGVVEIQDPELENKLTEGELQKLYAKFPYLNPNRPLQPKPKTEKVEFRKEQSDEKETVQKEKEEVVEESTFDEFVESLSTKELADWMKENDFEFDGRKKKNRNYLIEELNK